ncbi:plasmalemma vesicle-associated protein [Acipenser oxyrinchus oxyrinchus]|uniref:Plasmalemma vesicle-associated protein n=1 Tax=Acipenser oxyrinchus oxyrinchus TaxID=40147 RepID=A0AAD8CX04_ACIOX|nr:plasmalemma vesicle-associated protein [Acipenser oxyrinchus oxyrinchus]
MYNSKYSMAKFGLEAKDIQASNAKSCGYYIKYIFFFSSLIQLLIITGLVLFMVYGNKQKSHEEQVKSRDHTISRLSQDIFILHEMKGNLTLELNKTLKGKLALDLELKTARGLLVKSNSTIHMLRDALIICQKKVMTTPLVAPGNTCITQISALKKTHEGEKASLMLAKEALNQKFISLTNNCTTSTLHLQRELKQAQDDKLQSRLNEIKANREKNTLENHLQNYRTECKEQFETSLRGINAVIVDFKSKIDTLRPEAFAFALLRAPAAAAGSDPQNCTGLSSDIQHSFQTYLNTFSSRFSESMQTISGLQADNARWKKDFEDCNRNRSDIVVDCEGRIKTLNSKNDNEVEGLMKDLKKTKEEKSALEKNVSGFTAQVSNLNNQVQTLNASLATCCPKVILSLKIYQLNKQAFTNPN